MCNDILFFGNNVKFKQNRQYLLFAKPVYHYYFLLILGLNIEVSSVCGVLAAMGILLPGNDIAASALVPLNDSKNKSIKRHSRNGVKVIPKTEDKEKDKDKNSSKSISAESGSIPDSLDNAAPTIPTSSSSSSSSSPSSSTSFSSSSSSSSSLVSSSCVTISDVVTACITMSTPSSSSSSAVVEKGHDTLLSQPEGETETETATDRESVVMTDTAADMHEADVITSSSPAVVEMISEVTGIIKGDTLADAMDISMTDSSEHEDLSSTVIPLTATPTASSIVCQGNHIDAMDKNNIDTNNAIDVNSSGSSSNGVDIKSSNSNGINDDCVRLLPCANKDISSTVSATVSMDVAEVPLSSSLFLHKVDGASICTDTASDGSDAISDRVEECHHNVTGSQDKVLSVTDLADSSLLISDSIAGGDNVKVEEEVVNVTAEVVNLSPPLIVTAEDVKMDVDIEMETETEVESDEDNGDNDNEHASEGVLEFLQKRWGDLLLNYLKEEEVRSKLRIQQENAFAAAAAAAAATAAAVAVNISTTFSRQIETGIVDVDDDLKFLTEGVTSSTNHSTGLNCGMINSILSANGNGNGLGDGSLQTVDPLFEYSTTFSPTNDISNSLFLFAPGELEDAFPATPILTLSPIIIGDLLSVVTTADVVNSANITFPLLKGNSMADISFAAHNNSTLLASKLDNNSKIDTSLNGMEIEEDGNNNSSSDSIEKKNQNDGMIINEESNSSDENFSNLLQSTIVEQDYSSTFLEKDELNHFLPLKEETIFPSNYSSENCIGIGEEKNEISDFDCVFSTTPGSSFYEMNSKDMSIASKVQNEESYRDIISSFLPDNSEIQNNNNGIIHGNTNTNINNNNDMVINGNHNSEIISNTDFETVKNMSDLKLPCSAILKSSSSNSISNNNSKNGAKRTSNQRLWKINPTLFPQQSKSLSTISTTKSNLINTTTVTDFHNHGNGNGNGKIMNEIKYKNILEKELKSDLENENCSLMKKEICTKSGVIGGSTYACVPTHSETVNTNPHGIVNGNGNGNGNGSSSMMKKDAVLTIDGKNLNQSSDKAIVLHSHHKKPNNSNSIKEKKKNLKSSKDLKKLLLEPENVLCAWMDACYEDACAAELEESIMRRYAYACVYIYACVCMYIAKLYTCMCLCPSTSVSSSSSSSSTFSCICFLLLSTSVLPQT